MRIVFMGAGELSCASLERLLASPRDAVAAVVTRPDRPQGRRLKVQPCAVRRMAESRGVPVLAPENVNAPAALEDLRALAPELLVVVAFGQILKRDLLRLPARGCVNVHASLLPKYRGAAPIQWAIANGEARTGVTVMQMDEGMDTGAMLAQRAEPIDPADTAASLEARLAVLGAGLLVETIDAMRTGTAGPRQQDEAAATYARKLTKEDGRMDWRLAARELERRVRAFNPWPCCHCHGPAAGAGAAAAALVLRVLRARVEEGAGQPGTVLAVAGDGPLVATGEGALRLLEVQPEGRKVMSGRAFLCGHALRAGSLLE